MRLSLYQRLAISLTLGFVLLIALVVWWSDQLQQNTQLESEQRLHLGLAEHLVTDNPLLAQGVFDYDALQGLFHTLMMLGPSFEFYYVNPNGKILTYSAEPGKVKREYVDVAPIQQLIDDPSVLPILGDDPRSLSRQKIFSAAPVYRDQALQGYLYMIIGGEVHDSVLESVKENQTLRQLSIIAISSIVVLLALLLGLFRFYTAPLCKMTREIRAIDRNQFGSADVEIELPSEIHDELQLFAGTFNLMLKQIQQQYVQLENIDEHRRVLLADLSHDLRTPLANLQGYIETLSINGEKLGAEERKRFIDISMRNARNLKRLIDQIFELAYLEGGQVTINKEVTPLGELLYDIAAKFDLKAKEKNIALKVLPEQFDYQAFVDIGKLERVLTNLIENALRHTPEHGEIVLEVSPIANEPTKLRLDVRDTGSGIGKHEIAHIFDARYRASNAMEDKNTHVGLGLAISKKLVNLLDSELRVQSELGKGTRFSFDIAINHS